MPFIYNPIADENENQKSSTSLKGYCPVSELQVIEPSGEYTINMDGRLE